MYAIGRRFGADWTDKKFHLRHKESAESSLAAWYERYGLLALAIGRFIPGVRAVVAPFAGALRASVLGTMAAITVASGTWYGLVTMIAFRAGSNWEDLAENVGKLGRWTALGAVVLAAVLVVLWYRHRRARHEPDRAA